jgi:hypothetical protein
LHCKRQSVLAVVVSVVRHLSLKRFLGPKYKHQGGSRKLGLLVHGLDSIDRRFDSPAGIAHPVILWGEHKGILQKISQIISSAGARPVFVQDLSDLRVLQYSGECGVAVAVTDAIPGGAGIQAIRDLKAKGLKVIACENGVGSWTIKSKCQPLLAGAVRLLDSSSAEFPGELRELIERVVSAEVQKRSEEHQAKESMHPLGDSLQQAK